MEAQEDTAAAARRALRFSRRVVIKVGTPVITHMDGNIALSRIGALVEQIALLRQEGRDVVIVTSGAIGTGSMRMRKSLTLASSMQYSLNSPALAVDKNGAAAVGQSLLMSMYETLLSKYNLSCAQVLLTESDINDADVVAGVCDTVSELLQLGAVPVVNENDAVTSRSGQVYVDGTNEIDVDNDVLAARLAVGLRADLLLVLTDMVSLFASTGPDSEPRRLKAYAPGVTLAREGINVDSEEGASLGDSKRGAFANRTRLASEGLRRLCESALHATANGVRAVVVTSGHMPHALLQVVRGEDVGTIFVPEQRGKL